MEKIKNIIARLFVVITILILAGCNQIEDATVYNSELLFTNAIKIDIEPYNYTSSATKDIYWIMGDSALVTDTVDRNPELQWKEEDISSNLITVVISADALNAESSRITNTDKIIWRWHPGMESGEFGKVAFQDGRFEENEKINYEKQPLVLESGLYYWYVWGWESSGREIRFSSKPQKIFVK